MTHVHMLTGVFADLCSDLSSTPGVEQPLIAKAAELVVLAANGSSSYMLANPFMELAFRLGHLPGETSRNIIQNVAGHLMAALESNCAEPSWTCDTKVALLDAIYQGSDAHKAAIQAIDLLDLDDLPPMQVRGRQNIAFPYTMTPLGKIAIEYVKDVRNNETGELNAFYVAVFEPIEDNGPLLHPDNSVFGTLEEARDHLKSLFMKERVIA